MAYRFDGTDDKVEFALGSLSGYTAGAVTMAGFAKPASLAASQTLITYYTSGTNRLSFRWNSGANRAQIRTGSAGNASSPQLINNTSIWYLIVETWAGGAGMPRFHVHDGSSWNHADASSETVGNVNILSTDLLRVGNTGDGTSSWFPGDVVCVGVKKTDSSDATVETLSRTAWSAWTGFGFDWLVGFEAAGTLNDLGGGGSGDETGRTGTTLVSDPAGWTWGAPAAPAFVPQIMIVT